MKHSIRKQCDREEDIGKIVMEMMANPKIYAREI